MLTTNTLRTPNAILLVVSLGVISLMVCIGVSRFGYGVLIDALLKESTFSPVEVGLVGTSNLFGYLVGSMWCLFLGIERNALYVLRWGTLGCALTLFALMFSDSLLWWSVMRFMNDCLAGMAFVISSTYLASILSSSNMRRYIPLLYTGAGVGILLSAMMPLLGTHSMAQMLAWFSFLGIAGYLLLSRLSVALHHDLVPAKHTPLALSRSGWSAALTILLLSYGLEGMGYIIYVTYIFPYHMVAATGFSDAAYSWVTLGIGAALGPLAVSVWSREVTLPKIIGRLYAVRLIAIALTLNGSSYGMGVLSSFVFGLSFMGITAAYICHAEHVWPQLVTSAALLTVAYSVGQAIGPVTGAYVVTGSEVTGEPIGLSMLLVGAAAALFAVASRLATGSKNNIPRQSTVAR